jgi:hypothetical protein
LVVKNGSYTRANVSGAIKLANDSGKDGKPAVVLFQLFPLFRFFGCVKDRCNECAPCAITCPARLPYSTGYEAILSRKGNNVATTPPKALDAFFLFLRNMHASTLRSALVNLRPSQAFPVSGRFYVIPIDLRLPIAARGPYPRRRSSF